MTAHEMVAKARHLPQISESALKLIDLLDETEDQQRAVSLIRCDALLTAKLLRICNSSALGLAERVASVEHAILLLGYNQVFHLALSLIVGREMTRPAYGESSELNGLWRHSFMAATAAERLAGDGTPEPLDASVAFTAGLLHDIGKLVMAPVLTPETRAAIQTHVSGEGLRGVEAEREVVGTDHAEVGACLLHVWRLPDRLIEAVANHHHPVLDPRPRFSATAALANQVAHLADETSHSEAYDSQEGDLLLQAFGLSADRLEDLVRIVAEAADRSEELLTMG